MILSIVGVDKVPGYVYYRAKVLQEDLLKAGPVPYSIVRSTQFDEFLDSLITAAATEDPVRLPSTKVQPIASDDIARAVADVAVGPPLNGIRNVAGPEIFTMDEIGRIAFEAMGDERTIRTDDSASMFSAMNGDDLIPGDDDDPVLAKTTYREWLAASRIDHANLPVPTEDLLVTLFITVRNVARSREFYSRVLGGTVVLPENPCIVKLANSWILMNPGGPPTPDKPGITVADYQPGDSTSIFLNLRVADIRARYEEWKAKGAEFLTPPIDRGAEIRCYLRDPDGYLIEAGQSTGLVHGKLAEKRPEDLPG